MILPGPCRRCRQAITSSPESSTSLVLRLLDLIDVDLLLGDLAGHGLGVLSGLLADLDLLGGDGLLVDGRTLLVGHDVLDALGKLDVVTGDLLVERNALDVDLLALDRNLDGLGVMDDVLADAHTTGLDTLLANVEALLVANDGAILGHRGLLVSSGLRRGVGGLFGLGGGNTITGNTIPSNARVALLVDDLLAGNATSSSTGHTVARVTRGGVLGGVLL